MPTDTLFRPGASQATVTIEFDGHRCKVPAEISVAAALLLDGVRTFRTTPVGAKPRAPYCMMGVCFDCLVEIDGVPSRQSCMTRVREGMVIRTQSGASDADMVVWNSTEIVRLGTVSQLDVKKGRP